MIGVIIFTLLALIIGIIIVVIDKNTTNNKKIDEIKKLLPNYNCNGCGFVTCEQMANEILKDERSILKCRPLKNKEDVLEEIKKIIN